MQLDAIKFVIGVVTLSIASYTDIKRREADDKLWLIMGGIGALLLFFSNYDLIKMAISISFSIPFALLLYFFEFGGADVKAIWAITLLNPLPPKFYQFPLFSSPIFIFPFTVLLNSLLLFLPLPLIFFFYNLYQKNIEFPYCFFGYKMRANDAKNKFVWSMEANGKKKITPVKNFDFDKVGNKEIWVTPKFPFLVFILIGFIISFIVGDLLFAFLFLFF
ncbi:MAG: prepilin peptidase [Thermoplasmata archaeon]|nr:prepilin peptidase [Thermoplasmata archaeon]